MRIVVQSLFTQYLKFVEIKNPITKEGRNWILKIVGLILKS